MEKYTHYVRIKFDNGSRTYFFGTNNPNLKDGDNVVVETSRGLELGIVCGEPYQISNYKRDLELKPILRIATEGDINLHKHNIIDSQKAFKICEEEIAHHNLAMTLLSAEYTLDKTKILFTYLSEARVDFRELLKSLAFRLHTRIELRQIGPRDRSKLIGGLGPCGLPLCCSNFLNDFDGVSIAYAKNQMLAINIPKLSGQCGKLLCCLKYEDETYTDLKKHYPNVGKEIFYNKNKYTVSSINVISELIYLQNEDTQISITLDEYKALNHHHEEK